MPRRLVCTRRIAGEPTEPPARRGADDRGDDNADDNPAPAAPFGSWSRRRSKVGLQVCLLLGVERAPALSSAGRRVATA